ncbi:hypothetical protein T05_10488 [Trichinella murrelli]|uniref:Uncharacterized protein n=1 Tax=Trichinella murrelli TaxID=144512 RepID=A0A0V0T7G1_9BILA|nr:hypothetical protein T05_10488 [Trichinella murrelli]
MKASWKIIFQLNITNLRLANMDCTHSWYVTSLCCFIAFKSLDTSENKIGLSGSVTSYAFIANP